MKVASVHIYPVKSLGGQALRSAEVEPWGLRDDRRWVLLEPDGTRLTAREDHRLLLWSAEATEAGVLLTSPNGQQLAVSTPTHGALVPTTMSRLESVRAADGEIHRWLTALLGRPVRLCWLDDPNRRSVSLTHGGVEGDSLNLADAGPMLLTSATSLKQLNEWMVEDATVRGDASPDPMVMARFRPTVVINDVPTAFDEDSWRTMRIGAAEFRFAEICDRCVMTTIDPDTLSAGKEPLRTLARHRQWDHKTWFGIRIIPKTTANVIHVGDPVEVLSSAS